MRFSKSTAAALAASLPIATAQTFTSCNPTNATCPKDTGLDHSTFVSDFTAGSSANASWTAAAYSTISYGSDGAQYSIDGAKQAPTMQTDFYIFFGRVDVTMKAAQGQGIISSIVFESDDLDEIDWEFTGTGANQVQSNFFGKGNTTAYDRVQYIDVDSPQSTFHTYSVDWNSERIQWIIDGSVVRTLTYDNPLTVGGKNYPQTPMRIKLGNWCGGCAGEPTGTVQWAGGKTNFTDAPFVMYVEKVEIQNFNPAEQYEYSDMSGDWQSIKLINGGSSSSPKNASATGAASLSVTQTNAPTKTQHVTKVTATGVVTKTGGSGATGAIASTQVPGGATGAGSSPSASASASSQSGTGAASSNVAYASASLIGLLFSFLML